MELHPEVDQILGQFNRRGYPAPVRELDGADRMKIRPSSNFITEKIGEKPVVHFLLGTRFDESNVANKQWMLILAEIQTSMHTV